MTPDDSASNTSGSRVDRFIRGPLPLHAALMDLQSRTAEHREGMGRKDVALASKRKELAERPMALRQGSQMVDVIAALERELARDREELARLTAECAELTEVWNQRARLAKRVQAYAARRLPRGTFDTITSTIHDGGGR